MARFVELEDGTLIDLNGILAVVCESEGTHAWVTLITGRQFPLPLSSGELLKRLLLSDSTDGWDIAAFWMREGPTSWPPEEFEYRELADIDKDVRSPEQTDRLRELARIIRFKTDVRYQYDRAEVKAGGYFEVQVGDRWIRLLRETNGQIEVGLGDVDIWIDPEELLVILDALVEETRFGDGDEEDSFDNS
jgi:hypothetical protein